MKQILHDAMTKNVMKYGNMGIKRTVSTRQVSLGLLASINKSKIFQKYKKLKFQYFLCIFLQIPLKNVGSIWGGG